MLDSIQGAVDGTVLLVFYVALCLGTGLWFIVTMLFGEAADALGDAFDSVDLDDGGDDAGGNVLSVRNLLLFCMGFGGAGAIAVSLGAGLWLSIVAGIGGGVLVAGVGIVFFRMLRRQEATTAYDSQLLVGTTATVTLEIKAGSAGEISARDNRGAAVRLAATSAKSVEEALSVGQEVSIKAVHGGNAVVVPLED